MRTKSIVAIACCVAGSLFATPMWKTEALGGPTNHANEVKFSLYSDLHYKKGMYMTQVGDLTAILKRAKAAGAAFAVHCGDMCNDYSGSPELMKAYLQNAFGLEVYGIYGNHELEGKANSMEVVTAKLTNRNGDVVWGTADGKFASEVGYYYFDKGKFRFVMLDTNYAWDGAKWVHNSTGSHGPNKGTTKMNSLGLVQEQWLARVLNDAAAKDKGCIVVSHAPLLRDFGGEPEKCKTVGKIFADVNAKKPGTVIVAINGHYHHDEKCVKDGIAYINCNAVRNVHWQGTREPHYDAQSFKCEVVDESGNIIGYKDVPLSTLWMSKNTWFCDKPLSAIVTVTRDGNVSVDGYEAGWLFGIEPKMQGKRSTSIKSWKNK